MRLNWYKTSPDIYKAMLALQQASEKTILDKKLIELIKIRASQLNGCAHCLEMHTKDALALGENEQRIFLLSAWRETPFYSAQEKAALALCESLTLISHAGLPDDVYNNAAGIFSNTELVELTLIIVTINSWNRLAVGFKSEVGNYVSAYNKKNIE